MSAHASGLNNHDELERLIGMLDAEETEITVAYVSNLLLSRAKPVATSAAKAHHIESINPQGSVTWSK